MSNSFVTPEQVAAVALALLKGDLVLGALVNREAEANFSGKSGATVHVRRPATLQARSRALGATGAITVDDITEADQPVTLDEHLYHAARVSDEDYTLNIENFSRQVLAPQVRAVASDVEAKMAAELAALPETASIAYDPANPRKALLAARRLLRDMGVPTDADLYAVVGTAVAADLLNDEKLTDASAAGDTSALRKAIIGKVAGCEVVESNMVDPADIVVFTRDAFTMAVVAPRVPEGVSFGTSMAEGGYALRVIRDYDSQTLADRSIVSTFAGVRTNTLKDKSGADVVPAIRIDTATA